MNDSGLLPAYILLDSRQRAYILQIISLSDLITTKDILPITLGSRDKDMQPKDLPEYNLVWTTNQRIRIYRQYLARKVLDGFSIDPAKRVEPIIADMPMQYFLEKFFIEEKCRAIEEAKKDQADLTL